MHGWLRVFINIGVMFGCYLLEGICSDLREHACFGKIWAVFVWEAEIPPLTEMNRPTARGMTTGHTGCTYILTAGVCNVRIASDVSYCKQCSWEVWIIAVCTSMIFLCVSSTSFTTAGVSFTNSLMASMWLYVMSSRSFGRGQRKTWYLKAMTISS